MICCYPRLPTVYLDEENLAKEVNDNVGKLVDIWLVAINQNGGFTKVGEYIRAIPPPGPKGGGGHYHVRDGNVGCSSKNLMQESFFSLFLSFWEGGGGYFWPKYINPCTKVWVSLKTIFLPVILCSLWWYWNRINMLTRPSNLLERTLFSLGLSLSLLNLPLEYLTLSYEMPWINLFNDVKQGIFYANLAIFWLIFAGEHLISDQEN